MTSDRLHDSLARCRKIAVEESAQVGRALAAPEAALQRLIRNLDKRAQALTGDGASVASARAELGRVRDQLAGELTDSLASARADQQARAARAGTFTVALFGRTMAGKSTIREALTGGDGSTIGRGAQNATRGVTEYPWNGLSVLDAPGIASSDDALRPGLDDLAREAWHRADVVLVLLSTDGIQEAVFDGIAEVRSASKPILFVLNYKLDLTRPVLRRRFIAEGGLQSERIRADLAGHRARLEHLAVDRLGMLPDNLVVIPVHAQAAFLARQPNGAAEPSLHELSELDNVRDALAAEVIQFGSIRRLQTFLDGLSNKLGGMSELALATQRATHAQASYLDRKGTELNTALDAYVGRAPESARRTVEDAFAPLVRGVGTFVEENLERPDVQARWKEELARANLSGRAETWQRGQIEELNQTVLEYIRQLHVESGLTDFTQDGGPEPYDPYDLKRGAKRVGVAAGLAWSVAEVGVVFGWWGPIGWAIGGALIAATFLGTLVSWFAEDRTAKLKARRAAASEQLRASLKEHASKMSKGLESWFHTVVVERHVASLRQTSTAVPRALHRISEEIGTFAETLRGCIDALDLRLYQRASDELRLGLSIEAIARQAGRQAKLRVRRRTPRSVERVLSGALGERVDLVHGSDPAHEIVEALRPARVRLAAVSVRKGTAHVGLRSSEVPHARGQGGVNLHLASRLVRLRIELEPIP